MKSLAFSYQATEALNEEALTMNEEVEVDHIEDDVDEHLSFLEIIEKDKSKSFEATVVAQQVVTKEIHIVSFGKWPEYKTVMKTKTIARIMGKKIKTKVPVAYRRYSKLEVFAYIKYPSTWEQKLINDAVDCAKAAAVAAIAAGLVSGAAGAYPVFAGSFEVCVKAKLGDYSKEISFGTDSRKVPGKWVPY